MDASGRFWPRSDLRVGDADRQAVIDELQRHYVEGRLTSDELGERVAHTLQTRTFGELSGLLADLPILTDLALVQAPSSPTAYGASSQHLGIPVGALLVLVGVIAMLWAFAIPGGHHLLGFFPFWPLMIWGFFFIGRPHRGGRRHF